MTEVEWRDDGISLFGLGTTLLRNRWRIMRWMFIGALVVLPSAMLKPAVYSASASFVPQGNDAARSGLASLAGQFGATLPTNNQSLSPDFYAKLVQSRVLLLPIVRDTFVVPELGGRRISFFDLFKIEGDPERREEKGVTLLEAIVSVSVARTTGVVELSATTKWRSVSLEIANELIAGINDYNQRMRQGQAAAERKFVEGRLAAAGADLRQAEDRMESFLRSNRDLGRAPDLSMERDRLQRDIAFRQQTYTMLMQSYEDARIREVRDTPVITIFESPSVPTLPEPRGRVKRVILGLMLGGLVGAMLSFTSGLVARRRREGDTEPDVFAATLVEVKSEMFGGLLWLKERMRR